MTSVKTLACHHIIRHSFESQAGWLHGLVQA